MPFLFSFIHFRPSARYGPKQFFSIAIITSDLTQPRPSSLALSCPAYTTSVVPSNLGCSIALTHKHTHILSLLSFFLLLHSIIQKFISLQFLTTTALGRFHTQYVFSFSTIFFLSSFVTLSSLVQGFILSSWLCYNYNAANYELFLKIVLDVMRSVM